MVEIRPLALPHGPEDPSLEQQIHDICCEAVRSAGGYLVDHPEEHVTIVVFGAHQFEVRVLQKR